LAGAVQSNTASNGQPYPNEEFAAFKSHARASDHPETAATWKGMAREAGFKQADELFNSPNQLARVYRFRH
jgi:hypothetical protein